MASHQWGAIEKATPEVQQVADKVKLELEEKADGCKFDTFVALKYKESQLGARAVYYLIWVEIGVSKYCIIKVEVTIAPLVMSVKLMAYQVTSDALLDVAEKLDLISAGALVIPP